jgi:transcriptional regulator with XRE-family HTH domain
MARRYHDAEWLEQKYHEEGLTQREIAELCGVSPSAIRKWMDRNDIDTREVRGGNHGL